MLIGLSNSGMKFLQNGSSPAHRKSDKTALIKLEKLRSQVLIRIRHYKGLEDLEERGYIREFPGGTTKSDANLLYDRNPLEHVEKVVFEFTTECNFQCRHCYNGKVPGTTEHDIGALMKVSDTFSKMGIRHFNFVGGEVSKYGDGWLDLCRHISGDPLNRVTLYTNGWWLDKTNFNAAGRIYKDTDDYLATLKEAGVAVIKLSIDGPGEIHDQSRGQPGLYDKVLEGISTVHRAGILPRVSMLARRWETVDPVAEMIVDLGRRIYTDLQISSDEEFAEKFMVDPDNTFSSFIDIGNGAQSDSGGFPIDSFSVDDFHCRAFYRPHPYLTIKANGEVTTCRVANAGEGYGNIHSRELVEILNSMQDTFIYKLHSRRKLADYLPHLDRSVFGDRFVHMCTLRAILNLLALKIHEENADVMDPMTLRRLNLEVAATTGHGIR